MLCFDCVKCEAFIRHSLGDMLDSWINGVWKIPGKVLADDTKLGVICI